MELERQYPRQSCQPNGIEVNFAENKVDNDELICLTPTKTNSNRSILHPSPEESSSSIPHWRNRRVKLFAVKALAIILLAGYLGHERWIAAVQKVNSRRRLTYVSPSRVPSFSFSAASSRFSKSTTRQQLQHLSVESDSTTTTTTTTRLRGASESIAKDISPSKSKGGDVEGSKRV